MRTALRNFTLRSDGGIWRIICDAYVRLKAKGYHLIYREFDELGDRTYHPVSNDDALAWATRLRNKNIGPSPTEAKLLKRFQAAVPSPDNGYYPGLALVGGAPAGAVLRKLFESKDASVRAAAAATCSHGIFDGPTVKALTRLTGDPSVQVRRAAVRALAMYANWRYADAQNELIRLATDRNAEPWDRLNAADGLGYAARLQVKGVRQDPPMFQALISLLQDKDEPVRSTAAGILAPIYEPTREAGQRRRSPEGGWDKWLSEITAQESGLEKNYDVCRSGAVSSFCAAASALVGHDFATGQRVRRDLASAFQKMMKAAESGYVPAQSAVAMMYAAGKGVEQNYAEAGKWWSKASEAGDLVAARHAWNLYRNGEGVPRNPEIANRLAVMIGEPIQTPRAPRQTTSVTAAPTP